MPPINPLIPHLSHPLRYTHTLYRRDASQLANGPLVSVIITVIILCILVTGATLYLARLVWAKLQLGGGMRSDSATIKSSDDEDEEKDFGQKGGTVLSMAAFKEPEYAAWDAREREDGGGEMHHRKARARGGGKGNLKAMGRGRSYSDELWSTQVDRGVSDDKEDDDGGHHGVALSRGLGSGGGAGNGSGSGGSKCSGGLARHSSAKRSRIMSLGGAPAGFKPLGMHPVREDDLVDMPLRGGPLGAATVRLVRGEGQGHEGRGLQELEQHEQDQRESWPLRTHMAGKIGGVA